MENDDGYAVEGFYVRKDSIDIFVRYASRAAIGAIPVVHNVHYVKSIRTIDADTAESLTEAMQKLLKYARAMEGA
ncbi:hypothetical protein [Candidatus Nitrososphaera gargensis]|nr:hypothetical protein [Candidatus Nitrososphaera gargensis]